MSEKDPIIVFELSSGEVLLVPRTTPRRVVRRLPHTFAGSATVEHEKAKAFSADLETARRAVLADIARKPSPETPDDT